MTPDELFAARNEEKQRRIYYQNIVYGCCHAIDGPGWGVGSIVCGTIDDPRTEVQDAVQSLCRKNKLLVTEVQRLREENRTLIRYGEDYPGALEENKE